MELGQYFLSVICATVISSIAISLSSKKGTYASIVKLLSGIFLSLTIIRPLAAVKLQNWESYFYEFNQSAAAIAEDGEASAKTEMATIITEKTQAYILDKASDLGLNLEIEVTLNDEMPPVPVSVVVKGNTSPYAKKTMQQYITDNIGIPEEQQVWK